MAIPTTYPTRLPVRDSQVLDREKVVTFTFDGRDYTAYEGDTIASALAAAGETTFTRSLKYHRPRGLLCTTGNCPNCLVQMGDEPDVRACMTCVTDGMVVEAQNDDPPLDLALLTAMQDGDDILPAGYTYKALVRPRRFWGAYEYILRHSSGFGKARLRF